MSQNNLLKVSGVAIAEPESESGFEGPKVCFTSVLHCVSIVTRLIEQLLDMPNMTALDIACIGFGCFVFFSMQHLCPHPLLMNIRYYIRLKCC